MAPFKMNMGSKEKDTKGNFSQETTKKIEHINPKLGKVYKFDTTSEVRGGSGFIGGVGKGLIKGALGVGSTLKSLKKGTGGVGMGVVKGALSVGSTGAAALKSLFSKTKNVPVIGSPGKTIKVPKLSKTEKVSFVNPKIRQMQEYKVDGKLYGHFTKDGKLTNKYVKSPKPGDKQFGGRFWK